MELVLPTRKDRQLLAYLAMAAGRPQSREKLAGLLWADRAEAQARDSLRQSLAALRQAFRSGGANPIMADRTSIMLDGAALSVDAVDFAARCAEPASMTTLVALYRGPFLKGLEGSTPEFDQWVTQERQRLDQLAEGAVVAASMAVLSAEEAEAALALGRRLLAQDRMLEPVYRAMMRMSYALGHRSTALKVYAACRDALKPPDMVWMLLSPDGIAMRQTRGVQAQAERDGIHCATSASIWLPTRASYRNRRPISTHFRDEAPRAGVWHNEINGLGWRRLDGSRVPSATCP